MVREYTEVGWSNARAGFAGIDSELYTADNTMRVFGDAKAVIGDIVKALSGRSAIH